MSKIHMLKLSTEFYSQVSSGIKPFEIRFNDRNYQVNDMLKLYEYDEVHGFLGRYTLVRVDYLLDDARYLKKDYVVMAHTILKRGNMNPLFIEKEWKNMEEIT